MANLVYALGWHGFFNYCSRRIDTLKGSFYSNPLVDKPDVSPEEREAFPEYYGENICMSHNIFIEILTKALLRAC